MPSTITGLFTQTYHCSNFVDDGLNLRQDDFNSSQYPGYLALGYEKGSHCLPRDYKLPNTERSDIFAMGSTLYELLVGKATYNALNPIDPDPKGPEVLRAPMREQIKTEVDIARRYRNHVFPTIYDALGKMLCCFVGEGGFVRLRMRLICIFYIMEHDGGRLC